jgi:hypothetical protein
MLLMTFRMGEGYQVLKKRSRVKKGEPRLAEDTPFSSSSHFFLVYRLLEIMQ